MAKKVLTIVLTVFLFISAVVLGGSTVFRVDDVAVIATVVSEKSKADVEQLKTELAAFYKDRNIFSATQDDIKETMAKYPYFFVTDFKKSYPNKIVVTVEEESEFYAVATGEERYYILGRTGVILDVRNSFENRLDGQANVLLNGLNVSGKKGGFLAGDECLDSMFTLCKAMDETLDGVRSNVLSVEVLSRSPETFYLITMREGIKVYVGNPTVLTEEKAKMAMNEYMALSNAQRMTGRLTVRDAENQVFVAYSPEDEFQP